MALDIDGFAVFSAIGRHRDAFAELGAEVNKTARSLIVKHLKGKNMGLRGLQVAYSALGAETLALIFDAMPDSEIGTLAVKCDKHNSETIKAESASWRRGHIGALAAGTKDPVSPSTAKSKSAVTKKPAKSKVPPTADSAEPKIGLNYVSAGRTRKR